MLTKARRGSVASETILVALRSRVELRPGFEDRLRTELGAKLGHAATLVERVNVRFEDAKDPRDVTCRIKLILSGLPSVQAVETASAPETAFARTLPVIARALQRIRTARGLPTGRRHARRGPLARTSVAEPADRGEIIGRRIGRGPVARTRSLERPEKHRRDAYVDTALPGVSASDRRAGGPMSARRNTLARPSRATAALEDSRTRPSRKATRRSANRAKSSQGKERTALARSVTPSARAERR